MKQILLLIFLAVSRSSSHPGLLKIPKVYNTIVTSDENLAPSRAFPVLQPVIHRTAIGYVPPLYYPPFAPQFVPQVVDLTKFGTPIQDLDNKAGKEGQNSVKDIDDKVNAEGDEKKEQQKLMFYPNLQTVLYDPYLYTYSGLGQEMEQATYQDYQIHQMLDPLPPEINEKYPERLLPHLHEENLENEEKIPDVPPPLLPTGRPMSKSIF